MRLARLINIEGFMIDRKHVLDLYVFYSLSLELAVMQCAFS